MQKNTFTSHSCRLSHSASVITLNFPVATCICLSTHLAAAYRHKSVSPESCIISSHFRSVNVNESTHVMRHFLEWSVYSTVGSDGAARRWVPKRVWISHEMSAGYDLLANIRWRVAMKCFESCTRQNGISDSVLSVSISLLASLSTYYYRWEWLDKRIEGR